MLGCTHPIYARRWDKIFDYSRKPLIAKTTQTVTNLCVQAGFFKLRVNIMSVSYFLMSKYQG